MEKYKQEFIEFMVDCGVLKFGDFVTKSGRKTPFFVNTGFYRTAALDPLSEYEIYSRFDELVRDKTSIYISHRMSSCRFCQDILVFQEGRLVERGSHETLLEAKGLYASLWNAQAQYYVK